MAHTVGGGKLGGDGIAGGTLHDTPTVVVTAIGTVTANPHTVAWTYTQAQGDSQEYYRVRYINDAGSVEYDNTGWITGAGTTHATDLAAIYAGGLDLHGNTDLTAEVTVRGPAAIGTGDADYYTSAPDTEDFTALNLGEPTLTPGDVSFGATNKGTASTYVMNSLSTVTLNWAYAHGGTGEAQQAYRVKLLEFETDVELFDTGWVTSAATSYVLNYAFLDDFKYTISMQARNANLAPTT
jgi:hypothetical protein